MTDTHTPAPAAGLAEAVDRLRAADAELAERSPTPFPLPVIGLEAVVAGTVMALERGDWWLPGLRERVGGVLRDTPLDRLIDGRAGARPYKIVPPDTSPALRALQAVGLAVAGQPAVVHLGVGSVSDGAFHEALNLAALHRADVVFVVAVHPLDGDAPLGTQLATSPARLAQAFGLGVHEVDGASATAVYEAVRAARQAGGPHLVEARLSSPREATP